MKITKILQNVWHMYIVVNEQKTFVSLDFSTYEFHQLENNQYVSVCWQVNFAICLWFSFGSLQPLSWRMSPLSPRRRGPAWRLNGVNGLLAPKTWNNYMKGLVKFVMLLENLCLFMTYVIQKNCWLNGHLGQNAMLNVMWLVPWGGPEFVEMMTWLRLKNKTLKKLIYTINL